MAEEPRYEPMPTWVKVFVGVGIAVAVLALILLLLGGEHGPGRHGAFHLPAPSWGKAPSH